MGMEKELASSRDLIERDARLRHDTGRWLFGFAAMAGIINGMIT